MTRRDDSVASNSSLVLVHGGLWEDGMDAHRFWTAPGIVKGLQGAGFTVLAPNRRHRPPNWAAEVEHLAPAMPDRAVTLIAGSNGCSAAVRLAAAFPRRIERLLLAWPATAGDPMVDARTHHALSALGASPAIMRDLLDGQTLRGVTDVELAALTMPVAVLPSVPENLTHQRHTVDRIIELLPHCDELPGCPEPPHPSFPSHLEQFLTAVTAFAGR